ncbi:MAG: cation-translocating P-type ATPase, partial [Brevefilum sp.]
LTTNKMTVQEIWAGKKSLKLTGTGYKPEGQFLYQGEDYDPCEDDDARMTLKIGALCNNARLIRHKDGSEYWDIKGDPTEAALVIAAAKAGYHKESLEKEYHRVDELPFSSKTKFMATFHEIPDKPDKIMAFIKGAPEKILTCCESIQIDGEKQPLDKAGKENILEHNHQMADQALRVLGLAYAVVSRDEMEDFKEDLEYEHPVRLTFSGLSGMIDPPRKEVPQAVARCKKAGIRVIMATGDHKITARAIAKEVGILENDGRVITGSEVEKMNDEELQEALKSTSVFARVAPDHKHRMVQALQELDYVVAMTGDGVNDAPALQAAEIGVAMGITGTDVTKETAEMVLTDDNFSSIVNAIEEGRVVFKNVRKVVKFLLATNIGEDLTLLASLILFSAEGLIISPVQILWVNLVTDGILDITLAMEPKEEEVMEEDPRQHGSKIVNKEILINILIVALVMAAGTLFMYNDASINNPMAAQTIVFTTLAMFQVFNAFNCRSRTRSIFTMGFFKNPYLLLAVTASILLQIGAIYLPFMQNALGTTPLAIQDWGGIFLISSSILIVDEIRKLIQRIFFNKA